MNLKQQFYKDIFKDVKYKKIELPSDKRADGYKKLEEEKSEIDQHNIAAIKAGNQKLLGYELREAAFEKLDLRKRAGFSAEKVQQFKLETTYPGLFSGSGYAHEMGVEGELKLGFFFDHATGLPILPGSSVKGVLRSAFPHFESDSTNYLGPDLRKAKPIQKAKAKFIASLFFNWKKEDGAPDFEDFDKIHQLELAIFEGVDLIKTKEKRAEAEAKGQRDFLKIVEHLPMRGHDIFLEAFISKAGKDNKILGTDAITPHKGPLKNPIPLPFLKVLPEVEFTFQFILQETVFAADLKITGDQKKTAFKTILKTLGIGAKTNVGYGQFVEK